MTLQEFKDLLNTIPAEYVGLDVEFFNNDSGSFLTAAGISIDEPNGPDPFVLIRMRDELDENGDLN